MLTKPHLNQFLILLLAALLAGCSHPPEIVAPEIDPPQDLIPAYVPQGYELGAGFQLPPASDLPPVFEEGNARSLLAAGFDLKSPAGNDIQGLYYQGKDDLILITKSAFPGGTLQEWRQAYEASQPGPCECASPVLRLEAFSLPSRIRNVQEERTVDGIPVTILSAPDGWLTVFVRAGEFLTVEGAISLDENLKIVSSLLHK
jgi:hypothetical protein